MADGGKAEDKAGAPTGEGARMGSRKGSAGVPREKPVIEGKAINLDPKEGETASPSPEPSAETGTTPQSPALTAPAGSDEAAAAEAPATEASAAEEAAQPAAPPEPQKVPRRRASLWPIAVAIVLGAAIAVGGAFGLRSLDKTPKALATLDERVAALEHRPPPSHPPQVDLSGIDKRVGALEAGAKATDAAMARLQGDQRTLDAAQKTAAKQLAQVESVARSAPKVPIVPPVDLAPLTARVGGLDDRLAALDHRLNDIDRRVNDLAQKFETAQAAQAAKDHVVQVAGARATANAVAIIATNLRRNVDAGLPFADDLSALGNYSFDKDKLAPLEPAASKGVGTPAALQKLFSELAPQILATEPKPKASGFLGRLAQDAEHLVRIRKIGDTSGRDLAAQVARIEAALRRDAVETALAQWQDLTPEAKTKSQAFGDALRQRVAALAAAKTIEADALAALARIKS